MLDPDVFIVIVFAGLVALSALFALVVVVPRMRREDDRSRRRESEKGGPGAPVH